MRIRHSALGLLVVAFAAGMSYTPPASALPLTFAACRHMEDLCTRTFGSDGIFGSSCAHLCNDGGRWNYRDGDGP
jgi:hypothetical protein